MQIVGEMTSGSASATRTNSAGNRRVSLDRIQRRTLLVLGLTVLIGLTVRVYRLSASGLAEDEANKVFAIRAYDRGDFTVNAEHPMLMKGLCYFSVRVCGAWNRVAGSRIGMAFAEETALRLPNAVFGALTVIPLFLLANSLFGFRTAAITAFFWAPGLNAIWFNRVVKEDTLLVFFMLLAFFLYNAAKNRPAGDPFEERLYVLSGVAFGLMLSSKYFPHYYGVMALFYYIAGYNERNNRPVPRKAKAKHFAAILATLAVFDFAVLIPSTWLYLLKYVTGNLLTHHGYFAMNKLYLNDMAQTPGGLPWYFYGLYILTKMPPPLLLAFAWGTIELFRRIGRDNRSNGFLFLRIMLIFWVVPMSLLGVKFLRYTLALMPFAYMTAALGALAAWRVLLRILKAVRGRFIRARLTRAPAGQAPFATPAAALSGFAGAAVVLIFTVWPAITSAASLPYPGLYTNWLGSGRAGYFFPHDEFYDLGARESIQYIAERARPGARVASEIPGVLTYYLDKFERTDITQEIMSHPRFDAERDPPDFVLLQPGRLYVENEKTFAEVETRFPEVQSSTYRNAVATRVYELGPQEANSTQARPKSRPDDPRQ